MVEFGEQLKRAREAKGITQQTLGEQLFVTRQTVSRWECGDRYPDLITVRKIADYLEISIDKLLSGREMNRVVERSPVIDQPIVKRIVMILYAFISLYNFEILLSGFLKANALQVLWGYHNWVEVILNLGGYVIQASIFAYGFLLSLKNILIPKRAGMIMVIYYSTMCTVDIVMNLISAHDNQIPVFSIMTGFLTVGFPCLLGAAGAYQYFCRNSGNDKWRIVIFLVSIGYVARVIFDTYHRIQYGNEGDFMGNASFLIFGICIYSLFMYQTYLLWRKRKTVGSNYNK